MSITQITDHEDRALELMISWFEDKPRARELVSILAAEVQVAEDLLWDFIQNRLLENATGDILDALGKLVQARRLNADTDAEYRGIIAATAAANNSKTQVDEITNVAAQLVGEVVRYIWDGPMAINLEYETDAGPDADHAARIEEVITRAVGGGVSWRLTEGSAIGEAFRFDVGPGFDNGKLGRLVALDGADDQ